MTSMVLRGAALGAVLFLCASTADAGSCSSGSTAPAASAASASPDIVDVAADAGSFDTLLAAVEAAGLVETLRGDGPFTVFAPTDDAFAALPEGTVESLLRPENREQLVDILTYHVVSGRVEAAQALAATSARTLQGDAVTIGIRDGAALVNDARLLTVDIGASNGVIHVIDRVLLPEAPAGPSDPTARLIERAIERGAPLFNAGNTAACAGIYFTAVDALLMLDTVSDDGRRALERAGRRAGRTRDTADQAWILREALDVVYAQLGAAHAGR